MRIPASEVPVSGEMKTQATTATAARATTAEALRIKVREASGESGEETLALLMVKKLTAAE
jgi:hypothetical protein